MSKTSYLFFVKKRVSYTKMTLYSILVTVIGLTLFLFSVVFPKVLNSGSHFLYDQYFLPVICLGKKEAEIINDKKGIRI